MARRKAKDLEKTQQRQEVLNTPLPSYPYGAKKPTTQEIKEECQDVIQAAAELLCGPFPPTVPTESTSKAKEGTDASIGMDDGAADSTPNANTETPTTDANTETQGDTLPSSTAAVAAESLTRAPTENRMMAKHRWDREGRLLAVEHWMDEKRAKLKDEGVPRYQAADMVWKMAMAEFPPPGTPIPKADPPPIQAERPIPAAAMVDLAPPADAVPGLYVIPENWPPLPDNATLQAELGWVQSQRLAVVEERGNATIVRLERASSPAPSKAALGWLETSIRAYAKFVDVAAKVLAGQADEAESVRRERMRLDEIRALLDEMHRDDPS